MPIVLNSFVVYKLDVALVVVAGFHTGAIPIRNLCGSPKTHSFSGLGTGRIQSSSLNMGFLQKGCSRGDCTHICEQKGLKESSVLEYFFFSDWIDISNYLLCIGYWLLQGVISSYR